MGHCYASQPWGELLLKPTLAEVLLKSAIGELPLKPTIWEGRGLVGCNMVPIRNIEVNVDR